jgi:hypothetical protein
MTSEHQAIITAYEQEEMTVEEISVVRELDPVAVKACLAQSSAKYRKDCGLEKDIESGNDFSEDDGRWAVRALIETGMSTDDDHLRTKIAMFVRDDKKGRREPARAFGGQQFNILMLNEQLAKVRGVAESIRGKLLTHSTSNEVVNV